MVKLKSVRPIEYELIEPLGEGAFSTVYKALRSDLEFGLKQTVALKVLKSKIDLEQWRDEFVALERVRSPHCVRVLGWDYIENQPALILEWIEGVTLSRWLDFSSSRSTAAATVKTVVNCIDEITLQIFEGLNDIHAVGNNHGDLSLQNVMLTPQGRIKLLDFGLAASKNLSFTAEFAAPEILHDSPLSRSTDLYSLGRIRECLERQLKLPVSATTQGLLHLDPELRTYHSLFEFTTEERVQNQTILAENLHKIMSLQKHSTRLRPATQFIQTAKKKMIWLKNLSYALGIALSLNAGNAAPDTRPAHVFIKTKYWVEVSIEGRKLGYTPIDLELLPGRSYNVQWKTKNSTGQRSLTPEPGQNMFISDQFFAP